MSSTEPTPGTEPLPDGATEAPATSPATAPAVVAGPTSDGGPTEDEISEDELSEDELSEDEMAAYREELRAAMAPASRAPSLLHRIGAEAVGTFALVLVTIGVALYSALSGVGTLGAALAAGLVLAGVTAGLGHVSGGHFNPAVTLGSAVAGRTRWLDAPLYWLAQLFGAVAAGAALFLTIPTQLPAALGLADVRTLMGTTANGWDARSPLSTMSQGQVTFDLRSALVVELIAAAVLVAVVLGANHRRAPRAAAPVVIGLTYASLLLVAGPITGGSLNPARSTAAALFAEAGALGQLWLFWVAPLVGAAIAGLAYFAFSSPSPQDDLADFLDEDEEDDEEVVVVTTR